MWREKFELLSVGFAAGAASGALLCSIPGIASVIWPAASAVSASLFLALFMSMVPRLRGYPLIFGIYVLAGAFCFLSSEISGVWESGSMDPITAAASGSATKLKGVIDAIPYKESNTGALVKALLTGDRSSISRDLSGIFRSSGASHILALSGMHLGVIYAILLWAMLPLGNSPHARRFKCAAVIGITLFYSIATGFSPSIARAFLFITLNEIQKLLGRKAKGSRVFCTALFIQLAANPGIIRSVSFQLSYLAMFGIIFLFPVLNSWYPDDSGKKHRLTLREKADIPRRIWQGAALSISCQIFTAPLAWIRFHSFPAYFLLTNLIAMPLTSAAMILSVAATALTAIGICPGFLVAINEKTVSTLIRALTIISQL